MKKNEESKVKEKIKEGEFKGWKGIKSENFIWLRVGRSFIVWENVDHKHGPPTINLNTK